MLEAKEFLGNVGIGITCPFFCKATNDYLYIVKTNSSKMTNHVLISEMLGKLIGEKLNLNFPHSDIIDISTLHLEEKYASLQFASQYIPYIEYLDKDNLKKATNLHEMAGTILFDHIFHNPDRVSNRKNLLFSYLDHHIYAIDNSHLFKCSYWTNETLKKLSTQLSIYNNHLYGVLLRDMLKKSDFLPYIHEIEKTSYEDIVSIVNRIPAQWLSKDIDLSFLIEFITIRYRNIEKIAEKIFYKMQ